MNLNIDKVRKNIKYLTSKISNTPELANLSEWLKNYPEGFVKIADEYLELINLIDNFSEKDLEIIIKADEIMKARETQKNSASHISTPEFVNSVGKSVSLYDNAKMALEADHPLYEKSVEQLSKMLYGGHKVFSAGGTPQDGDPVSDKVIWGHTQIRKDAKSQTFAYFLTPHFLARFFTFLLEEYEILREKDDFFTPLTSALLLYEIQNPDKLGITKAWLTPREQGGLSWLKLEHIEAYKEALHEIN